MRPTPFAVANQAFPLAETVIARIPSSGTQRMPWRYSQVLPSKRIAPRDVPNQTTPGSPAAIAVKSSYGKPSAPVKSFHPLASRWPAPCGLANQSPPSASNATARTSVGAQLRGPSLGYSVLQLPVGFMTNKPSDAATANSPAGLTAICRISLALAGKSIRVNLATPALTV